MEKTTLKQVINGSSQVRKELAKALGCNISYVYMLEKGDRRPGPDKAAKIEEFFHGQITFEDLLKPDGA